MFTPAPGETLLRLEAMLAALPEEPEAFVRLASGVRDWEELLRTAQEQGVARTMLHALERGEGAPPHLRRHARRVLTGARLRQPRRAEALREILEALEAAGLCASPLKGPCLAARVYPEPALRPSADLDVLVREADLPVALASLGRSGFHQPPRGQEYYRRHHHHLHLVRADTPHLELHFRALVGFGAVLPAEPILERASAGAEGWLVPSPEDEVLYLLLHAASHLFQRLSWLFDIKLLLRNHPGVDWSAVADRAREHGFAAVLAVALRVQAERLQMRLPEPTSLGLPAPDQPRLLVGHRMLASAAQMPIRWRARTAVKLGYSALLCPSPRAAARFLGHRLAWIARRRAQRAFPDRCPAEWRVN